MSRILVLIRHGERDSQDTKNPNNGLNIQGKEQALNLIEHFRQRFPKVDASISVTLLSSPKQRCQETLQPLAKALKLAVATHSDLDESNKYESPAAFQTRVESFLYDWKSSDKEITIVCTHGDWIPMAVELSTGQQISPDKGSWTELEQGRLEEKDQRVLFRKILQSKALKFKAS